MATQIEELFVKVSADGRGLDTDFKSILTKFTGLSTGALAAIAGIGAGFAAVGVAAFKLGREFEEANKIIIAGTGASGAALDDLKGSFTDVFAGVPDSAAVAAKALTSLNTLTGQTGDSLENLTVQVLDASRALGEDAAGNATKLGKALNAFGIEAEDAAKQTDFLFKLTQDFDVGLGSLSGAVSEYGVVLKNAGFTMEASAELFARLEASGISVSRIMPGLNAAFRRFAQAGLEPKAALEAVIKAMQDAGTESEALTIATAQFGAEGAQRFTTAVRAGMIPALDELGLGLENAEGQIQRTTDASETFADKLGTTFNKLKAAFGGVGAATLDPLNNSLDQLNAALDAVGPTLLARRLLAA
jgi:TP901 family phage tail tape measure protein